MGRLLWQTFKYSAILLDVPTLVLHAQAFLATILRYRKLSKVYSSCLPSSTSRPSPHAPIPHLNHSQLSTLYSPSPHRSSYHPPFKLRPDFGHGGLPPLPRINSKDIETRVFTHRSITARLTIVFEDTPDDPSPDDELFSRSSSPYPPPLTFCFFPVLTKQYKHKT